MEINPKYKTYIRGTYNKAVDVCPFCGNKMSSEIFENCIGVATDIFSQNVMVIECNECFEHFYFHFDVNSYKCLVSIIKEGKNNHFNNIKYE